MSKPYSLGAMIAAGSVPVALKISRDGFTMPPMQWWEWLFAAGLLLFVVWCSRESRSRSHAGEIGNAPPHQNTAESLAFRLGQALHRVLKRRSHLPPIRNDAR